MFWFLAKLGVKIDPLNYNLSKIPQNMLKRITLASKKSKNNWKIVFGSLWVLILPQHVFIIFYWKVGETRGKMMISAKNNTNFQDLHWGNLNTYKFSCPWNIVCLSSVILDDENRPEQIGLSNVIISAISCFRSHCVKSPQRDFGVVIF